MPTLRFNTNQGRETLAQLQKTVEMMEAELSTARSRVNSLVPGGWEASAAHQFQDEVAGWGQSFARLLEYLRNLNQRLNAEIEEWEATASHFGGGEIGNAASVGAAGGYLSGFSGGGGGGGGGGSITSERDLRIDHTVIEQGGAYTKEPDIYLYQQEGGIEDAAYDKRYGDVELSAVGYEAAGSAGITVGDDGLEAKFEGGAEAYLGQVELETEVAGVEVAADAQVGASIAGEAELEVDLAAGEGELDIDVGAFAGVSAEAQAEKDFGVAEVGVSGEVGAGIGANANVELEFEDGSVTFEGDVSAFLGVGGGVGFSVELDIPEIADEVTNIGSDVVDFVDDSIFGWL